MNEQQIKQSLQSKTSQQIMLTLVRLISHKHPQLESTLHEEMVLDGVETRNNALEWCTKRIENLMDNQLINNYQARIKKQQKLFLNLTSNYQRYPFVEYNNRAEIKPLTRKIAVKVANNVLIQVPNSPKVTE